MANPGVNENPGITLASPPTHARINSHPAPRICTTASASRRTLARFHHPIRALSLRHRGTSSNPYKPPILVVLRAQLGLVEGLRGRPKAPPAQARNLVLELLDQKIAVAPLGLPRRQLDPQGQHYRLQRGDIVVHLAISLTDLFPAPAGYGQKPLPPAVPIAQTSGHIQFGSPTLEQVNPSTPCLWPTISTDASPFRPLLRSRYVRTPWYPIGTFAIGMANHSRPRPIRKAHSTLRAIIFVTTQDIS